MEEEKYIITFEDGECYFTDEITNKEQDHWDNGIINSIINITTMMYYVGKDSWESIQEWKN